jgi:hypothetical protein
MAQDVLGHGDVPNRPLLHPVAQVTQPALLDPACE